MSTASVDKLKKFVSIAKDEVGYKEGAGNKTKYGKWYGLDGHPWCAMFVSWCAHQAGILDGIVPKYSLCSDGANWYKKQNRYKAVTSGYKPKTGDIVFFRRNGRIGHTGIVSKYDEDKDMLYTIEGNHSDKVAKVGYKLKPFSYRSTEDEHDFDSDTFNDDVYGYDLSTMSYSNFSASSKIDGYGIN